MYKVKKKLHINELSDFEINIQSREGYKLRNVIYIVMVLTINLGIMNLLPFPALDGGRLFFMLIELVRGKPINPKYEGYIHAGGMILLLILMAVVAFKDIIFLFI